MRITCSGIDSPVLEIKPQYYKCDEWQNFLGQLPLGKVKVGIDVTGEFIIGYAQLVKKGIYKLCPFIYGSQEAIFVIEGNRAKEHIIIPPTDKLNDKFYKKVVTVRTAKVVLTFA